MLNHELITGDVKIHSFCVKLPVNSVLISPLSLLLLSLYENADHNSICIS